MNTMIIYSSKYGCTKDCANYLKSGLSGSAVLTDIDHETIDASVLEHYDTVILGSSIYIGAISKKMKTLCKDYMVLLSRKRLGIFVCCGFKEQSNEYFTANFPPELLKSAIIMKEFGGEARTDKMKFFDKFVMKAAMKGHPDTLKISRENMDRFIEVLNM